MAVRVIKLSLEFIYVNSSCKCLPQVSLVPPGLARKRVWNKKYPICITLAEGEVGEESLVEGQEEEERAEYVTVSPDHQPSVTLYLFGRTGRDKEDWFQHFTSASKTRTQCSVSTEENTGKNICSWGCEAVCRVKTLLS